MDKICIVACNNYIHEIKAIVSAMGEDAITARSFASEGCCNRCHKHIQDEINQLARDDQHIIVLGGSCVQTLRKPDTLPEDSLTVLYKDQCQFFLVNQSLVHYYQSNQSYLVSAGWLKNWKDNINAWGGDQCIHRQMMRECVQKIIVLDTGIHKNIDDDMQALSDYLTLPVDRIPVGLDVFYLHVKQAVQQHIHTQRHKTLVRTLTTSRREVSDYVMCFDMIQRMVHKKQIDDVIQDIFEIFKMLCSPRRLFFIKKTNLGNEILPAGKGNPPQFGADSLQQFLSQRGCALTEDRRGFSVSFSFGQEDFGCLVVEEVMYPEYSKHYMEMGRVISHPCAIAIANAHAFERLKFSEEKQRRIQLKMLEAQKMESLGNLAGGIAHDFNNLLMVIQGNADLLTQDDSLDSDTRHSLRDIITASQKASQLTKQMLDYSGKGHFVRKTLNLNDFVESVKPLLESSISKRHHLRYDISDTKPIEGDATQIEQVLVNLVTNASEAMEETNGEIVIATGIKTITSGTAFFDHVKRITMARGEYVYFSVSDTGCGIDESAIDKIFDPFYTTKFMGRGLGLAAVQGIVHGHDGGIALQSRAGQGTVFHVFIPVMKERISTAEPKQDPSPRNQCRILVIDDEEFIRSLIERMLEHLHCTGIFASDGQQGIDLFEKEQLNIDVVLLDLSMPVMDGHTCLSHIRVLNEKIPVILMSGYSEQEIKSRFDGELNLDFIQKPFGFEDIKKKLSQYTHIDSVHVSS